MEPEAEGRGVGIIAAILAGDGWGQGPEERETESQRLLTSVYSDSQTHTRRPPSTAGSLLIAPRSPVGNAPLDQRSHDAQTDTEEQRGRERSQKLMHPVRYKETHTDTRTEPETQRCIVKQDVQTHHTQKY